MMAKRNNDAKTKNRPALWRGKAAVLVVGLVVALTAVCLLSPAQAFAAPNPGEVDVCGAAAECNTFVEKYLNPVIIFLTAVVGIAAVVSIIMAGIQYASSADDPGTVSKAKTRIFNTVIGLVAYIFLLAFFNYLVPGGFF